MIDLPIQPLMPLAPMAGKAPVQPEPGTEAAEVFARMIQTACDTIAAAPVQGEDVTSTDAEPQDGEAVKDQIALLLQQLGLAGEGMSKPCPPHDEGCGELMLPKSARAEPVEGLRFSPEKESFSTSSGQTAGVMDTGSRERHVDAALSPFLDVLTSAASDSAVDATGFVQLMPSTSLAEAVKATPLDGAPAPDIVQHQLDLAHDAEWLDQLARDIARTADGGGRLRFQLNPEHLGSLHVEITAGAQGASVRMSADNEAARNLIADAQPRLLAEARAQGMRIAETQIDLGGGQGGHRERGQPMPAMLRTQNFAPEPISGPNTLQRDRYA